MLGWNNFTGIYMAKPAGAILVMTYWSYKDGLIQSYTIPYLKILSEVLGRSTPLYVLTLEKPEIGLSKEELQQANIELKPWNITILPEPYIPLSGKAALAWVKIVYKLWRLIGKKNVHTIHPFCAPAGMFAYMLSVITRRPLVLDSFEPHAESMVESGVWSKNSIAFRLLYYFEKRQTCRARYFVAVASGMQDYAREKYEVNIPDKRFFVKPACTDLDLFKLDKRKQPALMAHLGLEDKIVGIYVGKLGGIYLDEEFYILAKAAENYWGKERFRMLLLSANEQEEVATKAKNHDIAPTTLIHTVAPYHQVADYLGLADFACSLVNPIPTKKYCTPIKDGEYWAMGLPVIIPPNISDDSDIIRRHKVGYVSEDFSPAGCDAACRQIDALLQEEGITERVREIAIQYRNFANVHTIYRAIYKDNHENV
jgi:hypothetical protein